MSNIDKFVSKYKSSTLKELDSLIDYLNHKYYVDKTNTPQFNDIPVLATHYALLPDDSFVFYSIGDRSKIWLPYSETWGDTGYIPYTLYKLEHNSLS